MVVYSMWHSFNRIKSVSNTDVHDIAYSSSRTTVPFFYMTGIDYIGIQTLSRISYAKFQNFQASTPFSGTFQGLEKWK